MYQKVILIGRVGQKQLGYTKTQKPVAQYSLATTKSFKDKQTGDWNEHTEWHRLVSFNQCAEHVNKPHLHNSRLLNGNHHNQWHKLPVRIS